MQDGIRRLSVRFEGEVQGVGFRWCSQRAATQHGLTGWVRNERDGSVSMELQGTDAQLSEFFGALPRAWGRYCPAFVIAEKEDVAIVPQEDRFQVRF